MVTVLILVGCALTVDAQTVVVGQPAATGKFSGMAWTWDTERNIVTLNDAGRQFRVQTTPDQIARLNHHQQVTVTGTLLGPEPIETVLLPTQPMTAIASGPATRAEVSGQIKSINPQGIATIDTARGPLTVWVAEGAQNRFASGKPVKVIVNVQPVRMVAVSGAGGQASGPTLAMPAPIPGDQAVVVGRILAVNPNGSLSVESPRGPISIWVSDAASFRIGDFVQVQTVVQEG
jgi:hypothetical protein